MRYYNVKSTKNNMVYNNNTNLKAKTKNCNVYKCKILFPETGIQIFFGKTQKIFMVEIFLAVSFSITLYDL